MKSYRLYEAQNNAKNYIVLTDGEGNAKMIDWDLSDEEIEELVKEFEQIGDSLESRVEGVWVDIRNILDDTFTIRKLGQAAQLK